jgi:hypothetical protein
MELDKAFEFAVTLAWEDLMKVTKPCSVRVEYQCEPGASLDYLRIWSDRGGGYQHLVCDYWTWTSSAHPSGVRFSNRYHSDQLARTLDFILMNQNQFTRRADACRDGLVLIYPPTGDERTQAATWMKGVHGAATNVSRARDEKVATLSGIVNG